MSKQNISALPWTSSALWAHAGLLPIRKGPVRFAVGPCDGLTSNSWGVEARPKGDVYIFCRDNFKEAKVSLHRTGRWRMGFTETAVGKNSNLLRAGQNRAWDVWDKPPPQVPNVTTAFRLYFLPSELAVRPEQRSTDQWRDPVLFLEPAPPGQMTTVTLFVTNGDIEVAPDSKRYRLACLTIGQDVYAQLVAQIEPEGSIPATIEKTVSEAQLKVRASGKVMPLGAYIYMLGQTGDGVRFLTAARVNR